MLLKMRKVQSILKKNRDFPKADLNGDGVVDTTIVVSVNIFL